MINDTDIPIAKIMKPSADEFNDFEQFIEKLDTDNVFHDYGLVKVIPPPKWKPRKTPYANDFDHLVVHAPIEQNVQGKSGIYELLLIQKKSMKLPEYRKKVECFDHLTDDKEIEEVEEMFWKNIAFSPPLYGADMAGTLFEPGTPWDLRDLPGVLKEGLKNPIAGVNNPYLYVGSWKTMFGWHKEDLDLYSINYNHVGKPKFWYCIPLSESPKLENFAKQYFIEGFSKCKEFLRHKTILINPYLLKQKIPDLIIHKVAQYPGEFVITSGGAYHAGFNWGFNIAEAVNFAATRWLEIFPSVKSCTCVNDSVKMDKADFYANILLSNTYGKNPSIRKICQENGATKAKLHAMRLEQDEVDSTETTDSRDEDSHSKRRQKSTSGGRMSAFIHTEDKVPEKSNRRQSTRIKTYRNTKAKEEVQEEEEEPTIQRISNRSKKIKKLGEEFDTSDWRKGRTTRNGRAITSKKTPNTKKSQGHGKKAQTA
jgi:jumonji domain-containing protein 2